MNQNKRAIAREEEEEDAPESALPPISSSGYVPEAAALFEFKIPEKTRRKKATDPKVVVLKELSQPEMIRARNIGAKDNSGLDAAVVLALHSVDGNLVNHADEEGLHLFSKWSAKVRVLVKLGYQKIHVTDDSEDEDFLSSMTPL